MDEELLHKTSTWDLVPLPFGKNVIGCHWVYKLKTNFDDSIERFKARLIAKVYSQQYGMNYEKIFALVKIMTTVFILVL